MTASKYVFVYGLTKPGDVAGTLTPAYYKIVSTSLILGVSSSKAVAALIASLSFSFWV